ncbi:MAG: type II toxin-antitoxin system RelE/ParE family toxin [Patescibacteria group bacterium]
MYKVIIAPRAKKQLKSIAKETHRNAIANAIEDLKENPFMGKKLTRDLEGRYSYRVGVYRIIYKIYEKEKIVEVVTAGHRSSIYQ